MTISVIIPVHNSAAHLKAALVYLFRSTILPLECIVVDDGSTDSSIQVAEQFPTRVIAAKKRRGPAYARNLGATEARGEILFFLDADVCVQPDTIEQVARHFQEAPDLDGVIGSYDSAPECKDFISQYRNLMHHFVHQHSREEACTFWSGCGAIRRDVFFEHAGFNESYERPAVEDIELGYRLIRAKRKLILDKHLQVKHLKQWTFWGLVTTDIFRRGIPWTELVLRDRHMPNDLNLQLSQRVSVALVFLLFTMAAAGAFLYRGYFLTPVFAVLFFLLGRYWITSISQPASLRIRMLFTAILGCTIWLAYSHSMLTLIPPLLLGYILLFLKHRYAYKSEHRGKVTSVVLGVYFLVSAVFILAFLPRHAIVFSLFAVILVLAVLNHQFYLFLIAKLGKSYAMAAVPFHLLYHFYNGLSFVIGLARYGWNRVFPGKQTLLSVADRDRKLARFGLREHALTEGAARVTEAGPDRLSGPERNGLLRLGLPEWMAFGLYLGVVGVAAAHHEPWFDEAQAWLLSRDVPLFRLMVYNLRPEGTPGLWHLILYVANAAKFPYELVNFLSALFGTAGVFLWLRFAPFPLVVKLLAPFTFYLMYQYAVVARSYVLMPMLVFAAAWLYSRARERIYAFVAVLCVLANTSVHGALIAIGLLGAYTLDLVAERVRLAALDRRKHVHSYLAFAAVLLFIGAQLYPLPQQLNADLPPAPDRSLILVPPLSRLSGSLTGGGTGITLAICVTTGLWLYRRRRFWAYLLPTLLLFALFTKKHATWWHDGTLLLVWLAALWIGWESTRGKPVRWERWALSLMMAGVLGVQIRWGLSAASCDLANNYSGAKNTAKYLKDSGLDRKRISGYGFSSNAILPYFRKNIFYNQAIRKCGAYWSWLPTDSNYVVRRIDQLRADTPDAVVVAVKFRSDPNIAELKREMASLNYREERRFDGGLCGKTGVAEIDSYMLFVRQTQNAQNGR